MVGGRLAPGLGAEHIPWNLNRDYRHVLLAILALAWFVEREQDERTLSRNRGRIHQAATTRRGAKALLEVGDGPAKRRVKRQNVGP